MKPAVIIKPKVGDKDILLQQVEDGSWFASCWCTVTGKAVQFLLTSAQVAEIVSDSRRNIDEILPDTPNAIREIFLTGLTPAEFDQIPRDEGFTDDDEEDYEFDE